MSRRIGVMRQLPAVLAAVLLTLSLVTLPLFTAAEKDHICTREHCAICAQYQQLRDSTGAAPVPAGESPVRLRPRYTAAVLLSVGRETVLSPVSLGDKLSC